MIPTEYIYVDCEMTGISPLRDYITQLGVVHVMPDMIVQEEWFIAPNVDKASIGFSAIRAQCGSLDDVQAIGELIVRMASSKPMGEQAEEIGRFFHERRGLPMIAHEASFDHSFLAAMWGQQRLAKKGLFMPHTVMCSKVMAQHLVPGLKSYSLDALTEHFGIQSRRIGGAHSALNDALMGYDLVEKLRTV